MTEAERDKQIIEEGGARETIMLSGVELRIGELKIKDRHIIFACMEGDMVELEKANREYLDVPGPGLLGALKGIWQAITGKRSKATGVMKKLLEGITANDYKLVKACVMPFNVRLSVKRFKELFWNSTFSEVQQAVRKIFDINHIEVKNFMAARERMPVHPPAAVEKQNMTAGSPASLSSQGGPGNR